MVVEAWCHALRLGSSMRPGSRLLDFGLKYGTAMRRTKVYLDALRLARVTEYVAFRAVPVSMFDATSDNRSYASPCIVYLTMSRTITRKVVN